MVQVIERNDPWGKVGQNFGQGMGDALAQQTQSRMLSEGLKKLSQNTDKSTPLEQLAQLYSIPGITPEMVRSGTELIKQQQTRNAYKKGGTGKGEQIPIPKSQPMEYPKFGNFPVNAPEQPAKKQVQDNVPPEAVGQPQVQQQNPLREEALPRPRWTPDRFNQEKSDLYEQFPHLTDPEINQMALANEQRELSQPEAARERDKYLEDVKLQLQDKFKKQLETKLQKKEDEVFKDISGENLINFQRGMERDLRLNPELTADDVANKWSNKALDFGKAKTQMVKFAKEYSYTKALVDPESQYNKLKQYSKIFTDAGQSEEFYNILRSNPENGGLGLSAQGAATISNPVSNNAKQFIEKQKKSLATIDYISKNPENNFINSGANSRKIAVKLSDEGIIKPSDSILSIAYELRKRDANFSQNEFFDELIKNQDEMALTPRQRRELAEGKSGMIPNWADLFVIPGRK